MPFYRINDMTVHMRGHNLPPPCSASVGLRTSDGRPMTICAGVSAFQCDWDMGNGKTCDRYLCAAHAHEVGKNRHHCPDHNLEQLNPQPQLGLFTQLVQP